MRQEPDNLDDERTWQQPLPGHGSSRPHEQPTMNEPGGDTAADNADRTPAPEVTNLERTAGSVEASHVPVTPSSGDVSDTDPNRTKSMSRDGSSEWDALPPPIFDVGKVVFDKYRLLEKIGEGGMGEVWRVWHVSLETERALKLIKPELAHNDKGWRRFQREARLMAKINHPNAVSVYDFRRTQSVAYIEMEYIRGRSLADVLKDRRDQPMPLQWTAQVLEQLCEVLQEAHGHLDETTGKPKPIIHRDLKPSNLMLVERKNDTGPPRLKVLDFGIAKIVEDDGATELTGAGDLVGTPAYMSPDQIRGGFDGDDGHQEVDGRSDIYSTGVVLYHLLTGVLPFRGSKMALLAAQLNTAPMPMKEANPKVEVPPEVERVVMQCLEKDPNRRPQTARELSERFLRAAGVSPVGIGPRPPGPLPISTLKVVAAAIAALVLIVGTAIFTFTVIRGGGSNPTDKKTTVEVDTIGGTSGASILTKEPKKTSDLWEPEGYAAIEPETRVPDRHDLPMHLKRKSDGTRFSHLGDGLYLPDGYAPESAGDVVGAAGWPRVIVRQQDKVRFIRIHGATYSRGDPRYPKKARSVRVSDFYIQETEVTNGEIERYQANHLEEKTNLAKWAEVFQGLQANNDTSKEARGFPAVRVDYLVAINYANSVGGLLPTESQWEWAAKSCQETYWFAWGAEFTPEGKPLRAKLDDEDSLWVGPAVVGRFPDDKTHQGVYDMVGNVRELCADVFQPDPSPEPSDEPLVDKRSDVRIAKGVKIKIAVRGGSFRVKEQKAMASWRTSVTPDDVPDDVGFRVVIECPPKAGEAP